MGTTTKKRVSYSALYNEINELVGDPKKSRGAFLETRKDGKIVAYLSDVALSSLATATEVKELKKPTIRVLSDTALVKFKNGKTEAATRIDIRALAALAKQQENEESAVFHLERELGSSKNQVRRLEVQVQEYDRRLKEILSQSSRKSEFVRSAEKLGKGTKGYVFKSDVEASAKPYLFVMLSDWHVGEVVKKHDTLGLNAFDKAAFLRRIRVLLDEIRERAFGSHSGSADPVEFPYAGIVMPLAGDFISGIDHPNLERTNDLEVAESKTIAATALAVIVKEMAELFPEVYVPCVVGNHGKVSRFNSRDEANNRYDAEVYQELIGLTEKNLGTAHNVRFDVFKGSEGVFTVNGRKYLLTHGNNLLSGEKSNFKVALLKGAEKLSENLSKYDMLLVGHFHQYMVLDNVVVNGSVKGYDYFAKSLNLTPQPPMQAMWIDHPVKGVISHSALVLDKMGGARISKGVKRGDVTLVEVTESRQSAKILEAIKGLGRKVA